MEEREDVPLREVDDDGSTCIDLPPNTHQDESHQDEKHDDQCHSKEGKRWRRPVEAINDVIDFLGDKSSRLYQKNVTR